MVGTKIDKYRIVRLLGEGGMGQVFEAVEEPEGRRVAIKTLRAELAGDGEMLARFKVEARALITVKHPGLVEIYQTGSLPGGGAYIAMEFVDGQSLRQRLAGGALPAVTHLRIAQRVAEALSAVHQHKIIHRDLKPENIMLLSGGQDAADPRVKVIDFGIAKVTVATNVQTQLETRTGVVMGTPTYMAPEQCGADGAISDRTDVYSLGILLYELTCGHPPFDGEADLQIMGKHVFKEPEPLRQVAPETPSDLELLVHAMLCKNPEGRPSMALVATALTQLITGKRLSDAQTKVLRLARESATVRYRDHATARLRIPPQSRVVTAVIALLSAVLITILMIVFLRGALRPKPPAVPPPPPPRPPAPVNPTQPTQPTLPNGVSSAPGQVAVTKPTARSTAETQRAAGSKRPASPKPRPPAKANPVPAAPADGKSKSEPAKRPSGDKNTDIPLL